MQQFLLVLNLLLLLVPENFAIPVSLPTTVSRMTKAESGMKIAIRLLMKCMKHKKDPWKTILDWRNSPNERIGTSPAQRLISRRMQTILPAEKTLLKPKIERGSGKTFGKTV